jgi:hypothetical protein
VTQSPINLSGPFSSVYVPIFNYSFPVSGEMSNWGYGASFTLDNMNGHDVTGNPTLKFDDGVLYLRGFVRIFLSPIRSPVEAIGP